MKIKISIVLAIIVTFVMLFIYVVLDRPPASPVISFNIETISSSNGFPRTCIVVITNKLDSVALYIASEPGTNHYPMLAVGYMTNQVWGYQYEGSISACMLPLLPHESLRRQIDIPEQATKFKIGLYVKSLPLARRFSWYIIGCSTNSMSPIANILVTADRRNHIKTEWSKEYSLK